MHATLATHAPLDISSVHQPSTHESLDFWIFFSPVFLAWWGHVFGSENFEKFWPHMGFPPEIFVRKSSIFSNKSHRWCLVVRLSAERSVIKDTIGNYELFKLDFRWKTPLGSRFFEFFDSKKSPSSWSKTWWKKNFHIWKLVQFDVTLRNILDIGHSLT